ncbi:MAG: HAD family hydrolase [bacterium]|nr:HAD family hydrolase [bacterium]
MRFYSEVSHSAIFLDRDGTINEDVEYLRRPEDLRLLPHAGEALRELQRYFTLIVITNQSGIARGYLSEQQLQIIHQRLDAMLAVYGVHISKYYYCPHHPDCHGSPYGISCQCRKPQTLLYRQAIRDFGLDAMSSWAIGDKIRDCSGAVQLGCRGILLSGAPESSPGLKEQYPCLQTARDLQEAADIIIRSLPSDGACPTPPQAFSLPPIL